MKRRGTYLTAILTVAATAGVAHLMQAQAQDPAAAAPDQPPIIGAAIFPVSDVAAPLDPRAHLVAARAAGLGPTPPEARAIPVRLDESAIAEPADPTAVPPAVPEDLAAPSGLPLPGPSPHERLPAPAPTGPSAGLKTVETNAFGLECGPVVSVTPQSGAMLRLVVTAPCREGRRITVRQGALVYTARTDALGVYRQNIPALSSDPLILVAFDDGTAATATTRVTDADLAERVILQSESAAGLRIHALEFGAGYGTTGHVWAGNPRDPLAALRGGGGYLSTLGDADLPDARVVQVYTLPDAAAGRDGVVRLSVEAEVTAENCGRDVAGEMLDRDADGTLRPVALTLSMPGCEAVGEYLVLKNLLKDLKIASNQG